MNEVKIHLKKKYKHGLKKLDGLLCYVQYDTWIEFMSQICV